MTAAARYPSPLKAIRLKCLDCCLEQSNEVSLCGATACPVYPLRFGKSVAGVRPLTAIVGKCTDCGGGEEPPKKCKLTTCPLHPFRLGKNPNRAGLAGKGAANFKPPQEGKKTPAQAAIQERPAPCAGLCSCEAFCAVCVCSDGGREGGCHD